MVASGVTWPNNNEHVGGPSKKILDQPVNQKQPGGDQMFPL